MATRRTIIDSNEPTDEEGKSATVVEAARSFLQRESQATSKQRERERDDLRFQVSDPEHQWEDFAIKARSAQTVAGQSIPPRPMLCVDTLTEPIELVLGQMRSAHLGIGVHPLTEDATDETAEVLQGLYRHIEVCSRAHLARFWAYDRGVKAGRGVYWVRTEYDPESSVPGDQRIVIDRLLYQDAVYLDSFAQQPDWSDGDEGLIVTPMPMAAYKREFPDSKVANFDTDEFSRHVDSWPDWFNDPEGAQVVFVGKYYRITYEKESFEVVNWKTGETTQAERIKRVLHESKINGVEELEAERIIPGQYIPLIPFIGRELQPVDGERHYVGMIRPAKDGARLTNYAASGAVEMASLEPRAPWLMEEGQDENYKKMWEQSNTVNFPVLYFKRIGLSGLPGDKPSRVQVDQSRLGPNMTLLGMGQDFVQKATATFDPSLGKQPTAHRSGRALMALQDQTTQATGGYLGNLAEITLPYEARVILDLIPHYYDRPGRVATILDENNKPSRVMLNAPFQMQQGRPQALPYANPQEQTATDALVNDPNHPAKHFDLNKGRYGVSVTVGKSSASRLQAGADALSQILQADPQLMALIGPEWIHFQDFPGSKSVETILRKVREQQFPFLKEDAPQPTAQQMQQMQQMIQRLQGLADKNKTDLTKVQIQEQAENLRAQASNDVQLQKADIAAAASMANAQAKVDAENFRSYVDALETRIAEERNLHMKKLEQVHEAIQGLLDKHHEAQAQARDHAHERALAELQAAQPAVDESGSSGVS